LLFGLKPVYFDAVKQQILFGNDKQKGKCNSRSFAALRMTTLLISRDD